MRIFWSIIALATIMVPTWAQDVYVVGAAPPWVVANTQGGRIPDVDCDFANNQYWVSGARTLSCPISVSRADAENYQNANGTITSVAANELATGNAGAQVFGGASRGNDFLHSGDFTVSWSATNATTTLNSAISPDGTNDAILISATAGGAFSRSQSGVPMTNATFENFSVYAAMPASNAWRYLSLRGDHSVSNNATFDLQTCTVFSQAVGWGRVEGPFSINGLNWCRVYFAFASNATATGGLVIQSGNGTPTAGQGFLVYGPNISKGLGRTPYVPTTTAAVALSADVITPTGVLATILAQSGATVIVKTNQTPCLGLFSACTGTLIDANGTTLLGRNLTTGSGYPGGVGSTAVGAALITSDFGIWAVANKLGISWDATGGTINLNGYTGTDAVARTPGAPITIGSTSGASNFWNGNITEIVAFSSKVAIAQNTACNVIVGVGDSITFGAAGFTNNYGELTANALNTIFYNRGHSGDGFLEDFAGGGNLTQRAAAEVDTLLTANCNGTHPTLSIFAGTNDIFLAGQTGAQTLALYQAYVAARIAAGWNYSDIVAVTMLPRGDSNETDRTAYNSGIVSDASTHGYAVARLDSDALIGCPTCEDSFLYFSTDKIHPNNFAQQNIANIWCNVLPGINTALCPAYGLFN